MDKPKLLEALASLPEGDVRRTKIGRLRELLPEIEAAQAAGFRNEDIARALTTQGLEVDKKSLETMLYRIRKERAGEGHRTTPAPSPTRTGALPAGASSARAQTDQTGEDEQGKTSESAGEPEPEAASPEGLTLEQKRQRREAKAAQFIKSSNPLLKHVKKES